MSERDLAHLGINWTGASRLPDGRRVLVGENPATRRLWSLDPTTGIGEPMAVVEIGVRAQAAATHPTARPVRRRSSADEDTPGGDHGPFHCERCAAKRLYRLRFSNGESLTKCLSCGELVIDGNVERSGRPRTAGTSRPDATPRRRRRKANQTTTLPLPFGSNPQDDAA